MNTLLCLGNSNTFGYEPGTPLGGRYPPDVRWTGRLTAAGWRVHNRGMNGTTVPSGEEVPVFAELIGSLQPLDAITVMFGTNDVLRGAGAAETAARMERFLPAVRDAAAGAKVILIAPPPLTFGDWVQDGSVIRESEGLAARYRALAAAQGVAFADAGRWGVALAFDGVHFTAEGHGAFFRGLSPLLEA